MDVLSQTGFPRSGTRTLNNCLTLSFPQYIINPNTYSPKTIVDGKNTFVIFREPVDCIASWAYFSDYMKQSQTIESLVDWWLSFAEKTIDNNENIFVSTLKKLSMDCYSVVRDYANKYDLTEPIKVSNREVYKKTKSEFPEHVPRSSVALPIQYYNAVIESKKYLKAVNLYKTISE